MKDMSSYMVKDKSISQISDIISRVLNGGYNSTGLSNGYALEESFRDCIVAGSINRKKVFDKLYAFNLAAVNGRYNRNTEATGNYEDCYLWTKPNYKGHWLLEQNHYQMLKTLQHYIYQCDEDVNRESKVLVALRELETSIKDMIISSLDMYNEAKWQ